MFEKFKYILNIVIVTLLLATVAIQRDSSLLGHNTNEFFSNKSSSSELPEVRAEEIEYISEDGMRVVNSAPLAKDIIGYAGRTPVKLFIKDDIVQKVECEPNNETPSFFNAIKRSGMLDSWNGLTLKEVLSEKVDAVSGATYSAVAIIANVQKAASYAEEVEFTAPSKFLGLKEIAGLLVIILGVVLTLLKTKNRKLLTLQFVLNVVVLGFWCGSFLSLTVLSTWLANGINLAASILTLALLGVVIIMPLLGKKGSYCHLHCPMGSAQELMNRIPLTKLHIAPRVSKVLNSLRYYLLAVLLFIMWLGIGFDLMNYEVFSAFLFTTASTTVLTTATIFLILSIFTPRPYCRFICPTGALITISQKTKA